MLSCKITKLFVLVTTITEQALLQFAYRCTLVSEINLSPGTLCSTKFSLTEASVHCATRFAQLLPGCAKHNVPPLLGCAKHTCTMHNHFRVAQSMHAQCATTSGKNVASVCEFFSAKQDITWLRLG